MYEHAWALLTCKCTCYLQRTIICDTWKCNQCSAHIAFSKQTRVEKKTQSLWLLNFEHNQEPLFWWPQRPGGPTVYSIRIKSLKGFWIQHQGEVGKLQNCECIFCSPTDGVAVWFRIQWSQTCKTKKTIANLNCLFQISFKLHFSAHFQFKCILWTTCVTAYLCELFQQALSIPLKAYAK